MTMANCPQDTWDTVQTVRRTVFGQLVKNYSPYQSLKNTVPNCPELSVTIGIETETEIKTEDTARTVGGATVWISQKLLRKRG